MPDGSRFPPPSGFHLVSADELRGGERAPVRVMHPDPGLRLVFAPDRPMPSDWYQFELRFPPEGLVDVVVQFWFIRVLNFPDILFVLKFMVMVWVHQIREDILLVKLVLSLEKSMVINSQNFYLLDLKERIPMVIVL